MIKYERTKRDFRVQNATANDVWEYRTTPPADWNAELQKVSVTEIDEDDDYIPARQYANQNASSSLNETNENSDKKLGTTLNQSCDKGGNSNEKSDQNKGDNLTIPEKVADLSESSKNNSWCTLS